MLKKIKVKRKRKAIILPRTANRLFPRKGNPGLLANKIILKSECILINLEFGSIRVELAGTIRLPSERIISPDSNNVYRANTQPKNKFKI